MVMNKSTSFQPVSGLVFSGRPPRSFPPFLVVWGGQTEREASLCNLKLHAARFGVCVGLAALVRVLSGVGGKLPNVAALQAEYAALGEQKEKLYADYGRLKKQVKEYDVIKRNIDSILRRESEPERGKENVRG